MIVSVINLTEGSLTDAQVQTAIRAVNRQVREDFAPYWGFGGELRLEGKTGRGRGSIDPADMRGDAILYLRNEVRVSDTAGFHDKWFCGIPYCVVYRELSDLLKEAWTVTLSHETLELIGDAEANLLVQGPRCRMRTMSSTVSASVISFYRCTSLPVLSTAVGMIFSALAHKAEHCAPSA